MSDSPTLPKPEDLDGLVIILNQNPGNPTFTLGHTNPELATTLDVVAITEVDTKTQIIIDNTCLRRLAAYLLSLSKTGRTTFLAILREIVVKLDQRITPPGTSNQWTAGFDDMKGFVANNDLFGTAVIFMLGETLHGDFTFLLGRIWRLLHPEVVHL